MTEEQFIKAVLKEVHCTKAQKKEIERQLRSDAQSARENGETWEDTRARWETPAQLALDFNENFSNRKGQSMNKGKKIALIVLVAIVIGAAIGTGIAIYVSSQQKEEDSKTSTNTSSEYVTLAKQVIEYFSNGEYDKLDSMCDSKMKLAMKNTSWSDVGSSVLKKDNSIQDITCISDSVNNQGGVTYYIVQQKATYDDGTNITYTISFNRQKEIAGFYLK